MSQCSRTLVDGGQITPRKSQKWDATEPGDGTLYFTNGDVVTDLVENKLGDPEMPQFSLVQLIAILGPCTNETLLATMKTHITTEVTHYKGQCYT
jgi:endo-1,4-beta-xylanase